MPVVDVPKGSVVQLDDGSHASVFVSNVGNHHVTLLPVGTRLSAGQTTAVAVTADVPLVAESFEGTTLSYTVGSAQPPGSSPTSIAAIDCGLSS